MANLLNGLPGGLTNLTGNLASGISSAVGGALSGAASLFGDSGVINGVNFTSLTEDIPDLENFVANSQSFDNIDGLRDILSDEGVQFFDGGFDTSDPQAFASLVQDDPVFSNLLQELQGTDDTADFLSDQSALQTFIDNQDNTDEEVDDDDSDSGNSFLCQGLVSAADIARGAGVGETQATDACVQAGCEGCNFAIRNALTPLVAIFIMIFL